MRTLLFTAIGLVLIFFGVPLLFPYGSSPLDYYTSIEWKMKQQAKTSSPRILIVGGSNLVLGVEARRLSHELHYPVYNLGYAYGLGIPFLLNMAREAERPGDIVLFSAEYICKMGDRPTMAMAELECPSSSRFVQLSLDDRIRLATQRVQVTTSGIFGTQVQGLHRWSDVYRADAFDEYGDMTTHLKKKREDYLMGTLPDTTLAELSTLMRDYLAQAKAKGVEPYFLPPSFPQKVYARDSAVVEGLAARMRQLGWHYLCTPKEMVFNDTLFYDSAYHLLKSGRKERTDRLIKMVRPIVEAHKRKNAHTSIKSA